LRALWKIDLYVDSTTVLYVESTTVLYVDSTTVLYVDSTTVLYVDSTTVLYVDSTTVLYVDRTMCCLVGCCYNGIQIMGKDSHFIDYSIPVRLSYFYLYFQNGQNGRNSDKKMWR